MEQKKNQKNVMQLIKFEIEKCLREKTSNEVFIDSKVSLSSYGFDSFDVVKLIVFITNEINENFSNLPYVMEDFETLDRIVTFIEKGDNCDR